MPNGSINPPRPISGQNPVPPQQRQQNANGGGLTNQPAEPKPNLPMPPPPPPVIPPTPPSRPAAPSPPAAAVTARPTPPPPPNIPVIPPKPAVLAASAAPQPPSFPEKTPGEPNAQAPQTFSPFEKSSPFQHQSKPFEAGEVNIRTMQSDIAELQAGAGGSGVALKPPQSPSEAAAPSGGLPESLPAQFSLDNVDSVIAEGIKQEKQKRLLKISIIVGVVLVVAGAAGFAGYKWLLPALETETAPPPVVTPPGTATTSEAGAPLGGTATTTPLASAAVLPNSMVASLGLVTKQIDLKLETASQDELKNKINEQADAISSESTTTLELFPRLASESSFLNWQRFLGMLAGEITPSSGLGERFSIVVDKNGRALIVEVGNETAATTWLDSAGLKTAMALDFLFKTKPQAEFGQFRQGRAVSEVRLHRFATNSQGLAIDYGFAGKSFIAATSMDTFTRLAQTLAASTAR